MSFFTASYQTSEQLELSRIARSSSSPSSQQQQQQHSTSLLRSNRQIPEELRAPPFNPHEETLEEVIEEEDPFGVRGQARTEEIFAGETASPRTEATSSVERRKTGEQKKERKRARTSQIGRMLFPPSTNSNGSPRSKRLSLPTASSSNLAPIHLNPLSASTSSIPIASSRTTLPTHTLKHPTKKTLSPSNNHRRTVSSHPPSSSSSSSQSSAPTSIPDGTLLALPLAKQLESLKERNHTLSQASSASNAKLIKATERIRQLEESLSKAEETRGIDAEGWEAEATRLAQELATFQNSRGEEEELRERLGKTERRLEIEQAKKRRARETMGKLQCEVMNRKWKEKWEIDLLEKEERIWEIRTVELEFELAVVKGELRGERAEREELQALVDTQKKRISALTASRKLLLESFNKSEGTISSLRSSLAEVKGDIAVRTEEVKEFKVQVIALKEDLQEAVEKGGEDGELREKKEKLETEVKELKAQLKASQSSLKSVEKSSSITTSTLEATQNALSALQAQYDLLIVATSKSRSPVAVKEKEKKRKAVVVPEPEPEVVEEEDEEESTIKPPPKPKAKAAPKEKKKVVAKPVEVEGSEEDSEDMYRPVPKEPSPPPVKKATKSTKKVEKKSVIQEAEEEEEEDEEETPRAAPVPTAVAKKKRKAEVLSDKSVNSSKEGKKLGGGGLKVKKGKTGEGGKKKNKLSLDLSEAEQEEEQVREEEPKAKKKKKKLFGGGERKAFDWQAGIENADVNGIIPDYLSPIKLNGKKGITGLTLGGGKKSIFS